MTDKEFKQLDRDLRGLERQMKIPSFKKLSKYSQNLLKKQYQELNSKLFNEFGERIMNRNS